MENLKNNKIVKFVILFIVVVIAVTGIKQYTDKLEIYKRAVYTDADGKTALLEDEDYYRDLRALGDFKDSKELCNEYDYSKAVHYISAGNKGKAYEKLLRLSYYESGYKDVDQLITKIEKEVPVVKVQELEEGDTFEFGFYEQDNDTSNGKEPIEWIIISKEDGVIHAMSKYVLDVHPFFEAEGKHLFVNNWLSTTFKENAFTADELEHVSRICVLQKDDFRDKYQNYIFPEVSLETEFTDYARSLNPDEDQYYWYMTRIDDYDEAPVFSVDNTRPNTSGAWFLEEKTATENHGVRPTIWLFADNDDLPEEDVPHYSSSSSSSTSSIKRKCPYCNGTGYITHYVNAGTIFETEELRICPDCDGTGYLE